MINLEMATRKLMVIYHAFGVDLNRAFMAMGLRNDDKAEKIAKKHVMAIINMYKRLGYSDEEILKHLEKSEES